MDNSKYGHLFNSKSPDIDFKEIIDKNKFIYVSLPESIGKKEFLNTLMMIEKVVQGIEEQR